ncbi:MAG: glycine--tRNA ligase subunit beta [Candidatus Brocadiia bacterium]
MPDLLFEILCEELPASYILPAIEQFKEAAHRSAPILATHFSQAVATPRRLTFSWTGLPAELPAVTEEVKGPAKSACYKPDGSPTPALEGFLRKFGLTMDSVSIREERGKEFCCVTRVIPGKRIAEVISASIPEAISKMTFPKSMGWDATGAAFARPVRGLLCILGDDVVDFVWNGLRTGRETSGHRILSPEPLRLADASLAKYQLELEKRFVVACANERRRKLAGRMAEAADECKCNVNADEELLDMVNFLVEWPNAIAGRFDREFLELPGELISATLRHHQFYFSAREYGGEPAPIFVASCNIPGDSHELAEVILGNENVARARLADALFFYREDRKKPLAGRVGALSEVVFHPKLGSYAEKAARVRGLIRNMSPQIRTSAEEAGETFDLEACLCAAELSRADLLTQVVYELPELQGVMGRIYARADGHSAVVAQAIEEMYLPRSRGDALPRSWEGFTLSLADRLDSLAGFFSAGLIPTSAKDPFGLRRASIGIIALMEQKRARIDFLSAASEAFRAYEPKFPGNRKAFAESFVPFFMERLWGELSTDAASDIAGAVFSVLSANANRFVAGAPASIDIHDAFIRVHALGLIGKRPDFAGICTTLERAANITRDFGDAALPEEALLVEKEERALYAEYMQVAPTINDLLTHRDPASYSRAAELYVGAFAMPLHQFFEKVFVNAEDEKLRRNRKALLKAIYRLLADQFADLTYIVRKPE